jgi:alkylation response protein AidB-like acyl-CoA dehydrogenase
VRNAAASTGDGDADKVDAGTTVRGNRACLRVPRVRVSYQPALSRAGDGSCDRRADPRNLDHRTRPCAIACRADASDAGLARLALESRLVSALCDQAVQIHGGYGYMRETLVERLYRDARLYPIGGGTREIMNEIISKTEGY